MAEQENNMANGPPRRRITLGKIHNISLPVPPDATALESQVAALEERIKALELKTQQRSGNPSGATCLPCKESASFGPEPVEIRTSREVGSTGLCM
ncbi:hypothetical protein NCC49_003575 [Naganishia albida]|nr:hypothetical protein NCC49_003575 [Naganishia albida]